VHHSAVPLRSRLRRLPAWLAIAMVSLVTPASAETVELIAVADNTLIESAVGAYSNGAGSAFFVGRNSQARESRRRGVLRFDVADAVPPGMRVTRVELRLVVLPSNPQPSEIGVHRVLAAWGESASATSGGSGAPAEAGDATWVHTFYDRVLWTSPGGDFDSVASAVQVVGDAGGVIWESSPDLVADVQTWLDFPDSDYGWLLLGGEHAPTTAKRFASREAEDEATWPLLVIDYTPPCDTLELTGASRALCHAYCETLDCDSTGGRASTRACEQVALQFVRHAHEALPCEPDPGD
jgi:hypothetical protein